MWKLHTFFLCGFPNYENVYTLTFHTTRLRILFFFDVLFLVLFFEERHFVSSGMATEQ